MNNIETPVEILFQKAEAYSQTTLELLKLKAIDKSAEVVSSLAYKLIISIVVSMFVLCINIAIALWLGEVIGKTYFGFMVVAGGYVVLSILIYVFRKKWIMKPVNNSIINQMLQQYE